MADNSVKKVFSVTKCVTMEGVTSTFSGTNVGRKSSSLLNSKQVGGVGPPSDRMADNFVYSVKKVFSVTKCV
jgi:hypothetical protein